VFFTEGTAYDPAASSNDSTVAFTLPFDLPVDIKALETDISVSANGASFAGLAIPKEYVRTDVQQRIIHLTFSNVPFAVFGGQHSAFQQFLASTTMSTTESMTLSGEADTDLNTAVGSLSLRGIEFSVNTSIAGLQGLTSKPTLCRTLAGSR
jgi:hypothetical protein